jgi:phosphoribosyl 1,2-cyclic phosphodiesterase
VRFQPLGSGSRGNATLVEFGATRLLVDAGLSARALTARLEGIGVTPGSLTAVVLTHEHADHARGVERFSRQHGVPVICSARTLAALDLSPNHLAAWQPLPEGAPFDLGTVRIEGFPVPHDAASPMGFVIHGEGLRVGIATDLGHATTLVLERLRGCNVLMVEANHDDALLRDGPYPWHLKQRVSGRLGHLSNHEAADLLRQAADDGCRAVVLAHLSERNNTPALARQVCTQALARAGRHRIEMRLARAAQPTPAVVL